MTRAILWLIVLNEIRGLAFVAAAIYYGRVF